MIYIHFPFCKSFCTYCDFYSVKERDKIENYTRSLLREISMRKAFLRRCSDPATLYIGGGTPSLWPVGQLEKVVAMLKEAAGPLFFEEFTVEVNPDDVSVEYAAALRNMGVNRISMGVQSFSDRSLKWMARRHNAQGAVEAFGMLRSAGFDNISLDLIFGYDPAPWGGPTIPEEELMQAWKVDLDSVLRLRPEHISAYQMGVEEGSVLGEMAVAGRYSEPSDELCAAQYALLQQMLSEAGYLQYEVSNFALPGRRAVHNSGYWKRLPYIGLGPGAHSFDGDRCRFWNISDVDCYIRSIEPHALPIAPEEALTGEDVLRESAIAAAALPKGSGEVLSESAFSEETLTDEDVLTETVMLGLRIVDGLPLAALPFISSAEADRFRAAADLLIAEGSLILQDECLRIPPEKLFISDSIIRRLLAF